MLNQLLDVLDDLLQDLDEAGFPDAAEELYALAYEQEWADPAALIGEVGRDLARLHARHGEELPANVVARMGRCMEIARQARPDLQFED